MNFLEERIVKDGIVKPGNVLKVDSFLNHQMDVQLLNEMGKEFKRRFADKQITKILTIEASGIAIARLPRPKTPPSTRQAPIRNSHIASIEMIPRIVFFIVLSPF